MALLGKLFGQKRQGQVLGDIVIKLYEKNDRASITVSPSLSAAAGLSGVQEWSWLYLVHLANTLYYLDGFGHDLPSMSLRTVNGFLNELKNALLAKTLLEPKDLPDPLGDEIKIVPEESGGTQFTYTIVRAPDGMPIILTNVAPECEVGQLVLANLVFLYHVMNLICSYVPPEMRDLSGTAKLVASSGFLKKILIILILKPGAALIKYYMEKPGAFGDMSSTLKGPLHAYRAAKFE